MPNILEEIVAYKREFISMRKRIQNLADIRYRAADCEAPKDFFAALSGDEISLIAEIKKASPSKGIIRDDFNPQEFCTGICAKWSSLSFCAYGRSLFSGLRCLHRHS